MYFIHIRYLSLLKWAVCIYFFLAPLFEAKAQKVFSTYPFQFDQIFSYTNIVNPSANLPDKKKFIQVGYNGFNVLSNNLATYYLNFCVDLGKDSVSKPHKIGLFMINDKEGAYLNRLKLMGQYAFSVPISYRTVWTSGLSFGFVNNSLKPNDAVGGESVYIPDADLGTWVNHGAFFGGISLNQIFNKQVNFLNGNYLRKRYASLILGYEKNLGPHVSLKTEFFGRTGPQLYNKYALGVTFILKEHFMAGVVAKSNNGLIPTVGVKGIPFLKHKLRFQFSWRIPTSKLILAGTGNSELMIEYNF